MHAAFSVHFDDSFARFSLGKVGRQFHTNNNLFANKQFISLLGKGIAVPEKLWNVYTNNAQKSSEIAIFFARFSFSLSDGLKNIRFFMFAHVLMPRLIRRFLCKYSDTCWVYRVPNTFDYGASNIIHSIFDADKTTDAVLNLRSWCSTLNWLPEMTKFKVLNPYLCTQAI